MARFLAAAVLLAIPAAATAQTVVFYGGDLNPNATPTAGYTSGVFGGELGTAAHQYDDFALSAATGIGGLFANFLSETGVAPTGFQWEIRTGVSTGNAGTLAASGSGTSLTWTSTGRSYIGIPEYLLTASISAPTLAAGTYWLAITPVFASTSRTNYISVTTGLNGVGSPLDNGNTFSTIPIQSLFFTSVPGVDLSQGLILAPLPPAVLASGATLGLAGLFALARRRRA